MEMKNSTTTPHSGRFGFVTLAIVLSAWFDASAPAHASILQNGSFESPTVSPGFTFGAIPSGWGGTPGGLFNTGLSGWPNPEDGQQYLDLGNWAGHFTLSQTFTIGAAGAYQVSWYDSTAIVPPANSPYEVSVDGVSGNFDATHFSLDWALKSLPVNLTVGIHTLTFAAQGVFGGYDTLLDNVNIALVPEPAPTFAAFALAALGGVLWRRPVTRVR